MRRAIRRHHPSPSVPIRVGGRLVKRGLQQALVVLGDAIHVIEQRGDHLVQRVAGQARNAQLVECALGIQALGGLAQIRRQGRHTGTRLLQRLQGLARVAGQGRQRGQGRVQALGHGGVQPLRQGVPLRQAYFDALKSTGSAVLFTAVTLAIGVSTWVFSALKFQVDMGILLTFMFLVNMLGAILVLPALAAFFWRKNN